MPERWTSTLSSVADEPMTQGLLERAKEGPRLAPPGPSAGHRVVVVVVALAIGLAAVLIAVKSIDHTGTVPANQVTEPQYGWTATVPDGWEATPYQALTIPRLGASPVPTSNTGLAFSMFDLEGAHPYDFLAGGSRSVPSDGAILVIDGGDPNVGTYVGPETSPQLPPVISDSGSDGVQGIFVANGLQFEILGRLGSDAAPELRAQMDEIVSSIRFPSPPEPAPGQAVEFHPGVISLGPSDRYPLRSVTPVVVEGGPSIPSQWIVVVHAPNGFYVLYGLRSEPCRLRWDNTAQLIRGCPARPGPWKKYGGSGLPSGVADVNLDGQLLVPPYPRVSIVPESYWHSPKQQG